MFKAYRRRLGGQDRLSPHSVIMIGLLLALPAATFAADRLIPLGIVVWVLYLVPLVLTTQLVPQFTGMALARSNELLSAAKRTATRAQRLAAIGQFAATIADKIETPLTALSGHVQLLMEDLSLPPKVRGRLQTVEAQIERRSHIIQDLLLYTRRAPSLRQSVDINGCVQDCVTLLRTECDRQHVSCLVELKPDLPPVEADRQQHQETCNHLIENALQAMPAGGSLCVRTLMTGSTSAVFSERHTGCVAIEVVDTGCGINPNYLAQIFQHFFTTKQAGHGTGLGLAIVQEAVRAHAGRITVESEPDKGTSLTIHLPVSEKQPQPLERTT